ncbi:MAG: TIGR03943 family protein [Halothece sp. Uz-M2-17]|nr:TIGR03943 family protein [Halothece sp. Uz-M2-17]
MRLIKKISSSTFHSILLPTLDALTFLAWGILLFKYWLTGEIRLLIHPNYIGLVVTTGGILLVLGLLKLFQLYRQQKRKNRQEKVMQHVTLFPVGWSSFFLLGTALLGLVIPPTILGSDIALQRGIRETLPLTENQPQTFRVNVNAEDRSLIDWIKTINAYPEPDAYQGEKVKVRGFVIEKDQLPNQYFLLAQFIITCCAIDAYPVALAVKLPHSDQHYTNDTWLEIEGEMISERLAFATANDLESQEKRQVVILAESITEIPTPRNPYGS